LPSISIKDKAVFSRQFSVMINAGVAIVRCLGVLADQYGNPKMKKALQAISCRGTARESVIGSDGQTSRMF
jgi:type II secretory pathway component PulF